MKISIAKSVLIRFVLFVFSSTLYTIVSADQFDKGCEIKGSVRDSKTHESIIGAIVYLKEAKLNSASDLDGKYRIKNITPGNYVLVCKYIGYKSKEQEIKITDGTKETTLNISLDPVSNELSEVSVIDTLVNKESDLYSRKTEINAPTLINSVSAKTIQLSPDLTVANVLQRVSGVSVDRNANGEGRYAIIRGMEKRYNYTLVNGIKIPSPDNKNRYVPMDIFPAELLERLEVIKALTPSMEGDAIGGAINLVMKSAPDKFVFSADMSTGYSQIFFDRPFSSFNSGVINPKAPSEINGPTYQASPSDFPRANLSYREISPAPNTNFGFTLGNRFFKNKLGVMVAGIYQNSYRGSNSQVLLPSSQMGAASTREASMNNGMLVQFADYNGRQFSTQITRIGAHVFADYKLDKKNTFTLYNGLVQMTEIQTRHQIDTVLEKTRTAGPGTGEVHEQDRSRMTTQTIYNTTLQGKHQLRYNIKVDWSLVYSIAKSETPDWAQFERQHTVSKDIAGNQLFTNTSINAMTSRWMHNTDQDKSGYMNISWTPKIFQYDVEFSTGGMVRFKNRNAFYQEYNLQPANAPQLWTNIFDAQFAWLGINAGLGAPTDANNYTVDENISAYYGQVKFDPIKNFQVTGGVRMENTFQSYKTAQDPSKFDGATGTREYQDMLPSVHFKYALTANQNIRLSYFASIARPGFFEIIPYSIPGENWTETGNVHLMHTQADNYDLRYEFFSKGSNQLMAGVFYKNITNPIEWALVKDGTSALTYQPQNFGNATNYGFELVFTKYFGVFGIHANYTYTNSSITTLKQIYYRDPVTGKFVFESVPQTRPLQGQSAHIGNFSLLYKNSKLGINAQLALVYTGRRISLLSGFYELDNWQKAFTQLDFSAEKRAFKRFYVFVKINNILNSPLITEIVYPNKYMTGALMLPMQDNSNTVTVEKETFYQTYLIGLRYKLN
jgi:outer membrane receptor protein involved in Fe transport